MNYTQRLAEANLVPSVGSVGDSDDNALAEMINGLYKAEVMSSLPKGGFTAGTYISGGRIGCGSKEKVECR